MILTLDYVAAFGSYCSIKLLKKCVYINYLMYEKEMQEARTRIHKNINCNV